MIQYVIDGSQKGLIVGAGIVEVDSCGFFKTFHFTNYHISASGLISEIYAVECALKLIQKYEGKVTSPIRFFTDNNTVIKLFNTDLSTNKLSSDAYISKLQNQILLVKKVIDLSIQRVQSEHSQLAKIAHTLSRKYLCDTNNKLFMQEEQRQTVLPLKKENAQLVKKMNLEITKVDNIWKLLGNGEVIGENAKFLKVIEDFITKHKNNLGTSLFIHPSDDIKRMLKAMKKNKKVNTILNTINKAS